MVCLHVIAGLDRGGAEGILFNLCQHNCFNKHIVISLTDMGFYGDYLINSNNTVVCLGMNKNVSGLFKGGLKLWRYIRFYNPDVIQTWMYHSDFLGGLVARIAGTKNVNWNVRHSSVQLGDLKRTTFVIVKACALLSKYIPRKVVCCSEVAANNHVNIGYDESKIKIIFNGYDTSKFYPDYWAGSSLRVKLGVPRSVHLIGMVARFASEKDHNNLLSALKIVKENNDNFICLLIGEGLDAKNVGLLSWIKAYDLKDYVYPIGVQENINAFMNALDLHVLSSKFEAFPNVLGEAMACGTPCVSTDAGDSSYIIGDTGWIVKSQDHIALASAISCALNVMKNKRLWCDKGRLSRARIVNKFSIHKMVDNYCNVWEV